MCDSSHYINDTNVDRFLGNTVDATCRQFHSYPLKILRMPFGYCFRDSTGTFILNDFKREPVYYDTIMDEEVNNDKRA